MNRVTVVGGGLGGLIAAIECAEAGASVHLLEARSRLGGRASSTPGPYVANLGPHALYTGGALWDWLVEHDLHQPFVRPPMHGFRLRWRGARRRVPPGVLVRTVGLLREEAPVEIDLRTWMSERSGPEAAKAVIGLAGVLTFDHDPGRLSAAFVMERIRRILLQVPPVARYPVGGWGALIDRLAGHARQGGVRIATGAKVDALGDEPTIVAVDPPAARRLLGDPGLAANGTRTALLDIAWRGTRRQDTFNLLDLDEAGFAERFTAVDPSLAPDGTSLVQALVGMAPGETLDEAVLRLERLVDTGWPGWRDRETWRRRAAVTESSGALDLPGSTWRDRPPVAYADGVWLVGDWVAAPGHLSEVSAASAVQAAHAVVHQLETAAARA